MKKSASLLLLLALCACASPLKTAQTKLTLGMTQDQVAAIMGEPEEKLATQWIYSDNTMILFDDKGRYTKLEHADTEAKKSATPESPYDVKIKREEQQFWSPSPTQQYE